MLRTRTTLIIAATMLIAITAQPGALGICDRQQAHDRTGLGGREAICFTTAWIAVWVVVFTIYSHAAKSCQALG